MLKNKQRQAGIGLLEIFLVLIIGAGILYFSIQQYLMYKSDTDVMQVRYNVDALFQAMGRYFRANCNISSNTHPDTELLSPPASQQYVSVPITTLTTQGYLVGNLPLSPLIDYSTTVQGYVLQFNQIQPPPPRNINLSPTKQVSTGKILMWQVQVAVLLKDAKTASQYQKLLQADCLSQTGSGGTVTPCTGTPSLPTGQSFAVFMRMPSFPSETANTNSIYGQSIPWVKQFTQMYTTDPILVLTDGSQTGTQYYVCGP